MVGLQPCLAACGNRQPILITAAATRRARLTFTLALRHMRVPGSAGLGCDVGKARTGRRIGDADQVLAGRALNLPTCVLRLALQWLITVGTIEFEFVCGHGF